MGLDSCSEMMFTLETTVGLITMEGKSLLLMDVEIICVAVTYGLYGELQHNIELIFFFLSLFEKNNTYLNEHSLITSLGKQCG